MPIAGARNSTTVAAACAFLREPVHQFSVYEPTWRLVTILARMASRVAMSLEKPPWDVQVLRSVTATAVPVGHEMSEQHGVPFIGGLISFRKISIPKSGMPR